MFRLDSEAFRLRAPRLTPIQSNSSRLTHDTWRLQFIRKTSVNSLLLEQFHSGEAT